MTGHSAFQQLMTAVRETVEHPVVIAISGGPDSVALACAAAAVLADVTMGHVNHGWRGEEAEHDEAFVRDLADRLNRPLLSERLAPVPRSEGQARQSRYEALERMRVTAGAKLILTGHTLDDQAETVLLHLLRGSGLRGMSGIPARTGHIIRPFLRTRRSTILAALTEIGQGYRVDVSNRDTSFRRNWLRHDVLPELETRYPAIRQTLARTAELLTVDAEYIDRETERIIAAILVERSDRMARAFLGSWRALHPALQRSVLRSLVGMVLGDLHDIGEDAIEEVRLYLNSGSDRPSGRLPRGLAVADHGSTFTIGVGDPGTEAGFDPVRLPIPGRVELPSGTLTSELWLEPDDEQRRAVIVAGPFHALLDAASIGDVLTVRPRRAGDRIRLPGGSRSLQDLFVDRHVPQWKRDTIAIVVAGDQVVWIPGLAIDAQHGATEASTGMLHLVMTPKTGA